MRDGDHVNPFGSWETFCKEKCMMGSKNDTDRSCSGVQGAGADLLDRMRNVLRVKHYSKRTEQAYIAWVTRFIKFHHVRHPKEMGAAEVEQFLTHLAVDLNVAGSTQNQALNAIVFL